MIKINLDALYAAAMDAPKGEWVYGAKYFGQRKEDGGYNYFGQCMPEDYAQLKWELICKFITQARPDVVLQLIAHIKELEYRINSLEK